MTSVDFTQPSSGNVTARVDAFSVRTLALPCEVKARPADVKRRGTPLEQHGALREHIDTSFRKEQWIIKRLPRSRLPDTHNGFPQNGYFLIGDGLVIGQKH